MRRILKWFKRMFCNCCWHRDPETTVLLNVPGCRAGKTFRGFRFYCCKCGTRDQSTFGSVL